MRNSFELLCKEILGSKGVKDIDITISTDEYLIDIKAHLEQKRDRGQEEEAFDNSWYISFLSDDWGIAEKREPGCFWKTYKIFRGQDKTPEQCFSLMAANPNSQKYLIMVLEKNLLDDCFYRS